MAWAALVPAAMSAISSLSSAGGKGGEQAPQQAGQGKDGIWNIGVPQTGGTLSQQQNGGQQQQGDKPLGVMDFINPAGSQNSYLSMLNPLGSIDPLSKGINSIFGSIFK